MSKNLGDIEVISASCNISTVQDGRGAIFTWLPDEPIHEFNMLYFRPNKIRGNHFHPEFIEYFLVVSGSVVMVTKCPGTGEELNMLAGEGTCFKTPPGTPHAVHAISDAVCMSFLTKPWESCDRPIVYEDLVEFDEDYSNYQKQRNPDYKPEENTGKNWPPKK